MRILFLLHGWPLFIFWCWTPSWSNWVSTFCLKVNFVAWNFSVGDVLWRAAEFKLAIMNWWSCKIICNLTPLINSCLHLNQLKLHWFLIISSRSILNPLFLIGISSHLIPHIIIFIFFFLCWPSSLFNGCLDSNSVKRRKLDTIYWSDKGKKFHICKAILTKIII